MFQNYSRFNVIFFIVCFLVFLDAFGWAMWLRVFLFKYFMNELTFKQSGVRLNVSQKKVFLLKNETAILLKIYYNR